jgi:hypothetical protein
MPVKKKKKSVRRAPSLFSLAGKDRAYKSAKKAKEKAELRAKRAWKKAQAKAKKKLRAINKRKR